MAGRRPGKPSRRPSDAGLFQRGRESVSVTFGTASAEGRFAKLLKSGQKEGGICRVARDAQSHQALRTPPSVPPLSLRRATSCHVINKRAGKAPVRSSGASPVPVPVPSIELSKLRTACIFCETPQRAGKPFGRMPRQRWLETTCTSSWPP